ncbi:MAG: ImmA/IrrE family metallo-endopeptidase [Thermoguttaceae bacterium]
MTALGYEERPETLSKTQKKFLEKAKNWIKGESTPTLKQLESFAKVVMVSFGHLFSDTPPDELLPIVDFRTFKNQKQQRPSPNLFDTIYLMQSRQDWLHEKHREDGVPPVFLVDSLKNRPVSSIEDSAQRIRQCLDLPDDWTQSCRCTENVFSKLRDAAEDKGIFVFINGIVANNTRRPLDHEEFRGFTLLDEYAPLIFINRNDTETAMLFTLAHELSHLAIGEAGLCNLPQLGVDKAKQVEIRCNRIAAELLVPQKRFVCVWKEYRKDFAAIARFFGVSRLVIARRALELEYIKATQFFAFYNEEQENWELAKQKKKDKGVNGGNFYHTIQSRLSPRFSRTIVDAVRWGGLLYREAYHLTEMWGKTFDTFASKVAGGVYE